jgi:DNA-binding HxlR family transcriptional regulator
MNQLVLSDYERRVLQFVNGSPVEPPVIPGAALWETLERLQRIGLIEEAVVGNFYEWKLTEKGKDLATEVWMA